MPGLDDAQLKIRLLGPLQAFVAGQRVTLPSSRKARALLAYLAVRRKTVHRDEICRLLFGDTVDPRGSLRWSVSRLRAALGGEARQMLQSDRSGLSLQGATTDLHELEGMLDARHEPSLAALIELERDLTGDFLDGLELDGQPEFEAWRLTERARCLDLRTDLVRRIVHRLGHAKEAVGYARKLVSMDAADESSWATLIEALVATGKPDDARRVYERARRELDREDMPPGGLLENALRGAPAKAASGALQASGPPTLAVLPCQSGAGVEPAWSAELGKAMTAAAARVGLCRVLVSRDQDPTAGVPAEFELHSDLYRSGRGFELRAQLVSGLDGDSVYSWAIRLEAESAGALADEVFVYFASHLEVDLTVALIGLIRRKPDDALSPRERYLLALPLIYSPEGTRVADALQELDAVVAEDGRLGPALCAMAWVRACHPEFNSARAEIARTSRLARRAVELCLDDPFVLGWAAMVITHTDLDADTGADLVQRALALNPHSPMALVAAGWVEHFRGEHVRSLEYMDRLFALDAAGPMAFIAYTCRAMSYYQLGRFDDSHEWCRRAVGHNASFVVALRILAASLVRLGRLAEAQRVVARMVQIDPSENLAFFRTRLPYKRHADRQRLLSDLAAAGLPENG